MITLTSIQEIIERSIFENIRKGLVDLGYLPDILAVDIDDVPLYPDTEEGMTLYETDLSVIKLTKGFSIEVFNESSNFNKGIKKVPRIILKTGNFLPGVLGGDPQKYFLPTDEGFSSLVNKIGGIEVDVPQAIVDRTYPGPNYSYTTFSIKK